MPDDFVESNLVFDTVMLEMDTKLTCHFYNTSLRVFCGVSGHSNDTMNDSLVAKCTETYYSDYIKDNFNIEEIRKNWFSEVFQVNYRQTYYIITVNISRNVVKGQKNALVILVKITMWFVLQIWRTKTRILITVVSQ